MLYDNLPRLIKQRISKLWKAQQHVGTIEGTLDSIAHAFDHWRYIFERPFADLEPHDFGPIHGVLRAFILEAHPDWERDDPQLFLPTSLDQ